MRPRTTASLLLAARNAGNAVRGSSASSVKGCDMLLQRSNALIRVPQQNPSPSLLPSTTQRFYRTIVPPSQPVVPQPGGPPKNEEIEASAVAVVNAEGRLDPPTTLEEALSRIDRKTHHLIQMSAETEEQPAVCKVISKKDLYRKEKEKKKQKSRAKANQWKQMEINWGTSMNDLKQKYAKIKEMFDKGKGVEIVLLPKKRTQQATQEQAVNLLKEVKMAIVDLDGKEVKPMDGVLLGDLRLFAEKASEAELHARRVARQAELEAEQERQRKEQEELERQEREANGESEEGQVSPTETAEPVDTAKTTETITTTVNAATVEGETGNPLKETTTSSSSSSS